MGTINNWDCGNKLCR